MPSAQYTPKMPVFDCLQYRTNNFTELAAFAPVTKDEDGKVYLEDIMGKIEIPHGYWIMKGLAGFFTPISDELFQQGYKPYAGEPL